MVALIAMVMILSGSLKTAAITNPHQDADDKSTCLFCHVKAFETAEAGKRGSTLLEDTIDAVCLRCHVKTECCTIGQKHMGGLFIGYSHPSDLETSKIRKEFLPKTLPLQDGKMTCNTCHFHRRQAGRDYKLVRLVVFKDTGVEWTNLCVDCHQDA